LLAECDLVEERDLDGGVDLVLVEDAETAVLGLGGGAIGGGPWPWRI
jgi:hypothetical protein